MWCTAQQYIASTVFYCCEGNILSRQSIYERLSDVTHANLVWPKHGPKGVNNASRLSQSKYGVVCQYQEYVVNVVNGFHI